MISFNIKNIIMYGFKKVAFLMVSMYFKPQHSEIPHDKWWMIHDKWFINDLFIFFLFRWNLLNTSFLFLHYSWLNNQVKYTIFNIHRTRAESISMKKCSCQIFVFRVCYIVFRFCSFDLILEITRITLVFIFSLLLFTLV